MRLKIIAFILVVTLPLAWYLFVPLSSDAFSYSVDQKLTASKKIFLEAPAEVIDSAQQPNILWIIVDDLGYFDTDLYGQGLVSTPNINRLADEGVRFTEAYTTSPICSPSRASMLTGRYNQRFGFEHQLHDRYLKNRMEYFGFKYLIGNKTWTPAYRDSVPDQAFMDRMGLPSSEITIAEVLKKAGYRTGLIGKWHLSKRKEQSPGTFGFDEFYGFYASHSLYSPEGTEGIVDMKNPADWTDDYIWSGQREGTHAIQRNDEIIEETRYLTTAIADESIDFLKKKGDQPFFLVASFNAPHTPFQVPESYYNQFENIEDPVKRVYHGMIKSLDDEIGRLLNYLNEQGLEENTQIFLVSDNGGAAYTFATENGSLKAGKITNFDGGVKVPLVIKGRGFKQGSSYDHPVSTTDLFTTTLAITGQSLPERPIDGVNLLPHVGENSIAHEYIFFRKGFNHGIRTTDYKLIWNSKTRQDSLLYHIKTDPAELINIYGSKPDLVKSMISPYQEWNKSLTPSAWPSVIYFNYFDENNTRFTFEN